MFNLWKTSQSRSSFSQSLLKTIYLVVSFLFLVSCDDVRAHLSSQEVKVSSQFWVWKGSSFFSLASEEGLKRIIEDKDSFRVSLSQPILWDLLENKIYWSVSQEGLFFFPYYSPHLIKKVNSNLVKYFYRNKIADNLIKFSDRLLIFFSPDYQEKEETFHGLNVLSIGEDGIIEPFFLPFWKDHLSADLLEVRETTPNHLLLEWEEENEIFHLDFDIKSSKEKEISLKNYENSFKIFHDYDLRASYQDILNRIAYQESLDSFLVEVFNDEGDYVYFLEKGKVDSSNKNIFKGYENSSSLSILVKDKIYDLNKKLSDVKTLDLISLKGLLHYEKIISDNQGFWLSWYSVSCQDPTQKIVGILRVPYAR